ncbi:MAG: ATP-binding protein [Anaeromyxobacter sp.]
MEYTEATPGARTGATTSGLDAEGALHFLAGILDALPNPVFVKDERHRFVLVNDLLCQLLGRARPDLLGRSDPEFFPAEEVEVFWRQDDLVFTTGEVNENEEAFTDAWGTSHVILTRKTLYVDPGGRRYLVGVITDITERKHHEEELVRTRDALESRVAQRTGELRRANDRLRRADQHKDEFLAVLSHELRNPLAPVRNALWLLDHAGPGSPEASRARETIGRQVLHLTRLIDDLLDVTRISRGKILLQRGRLDLVDLVRRTAEDHRPLFSARQVRLEVAAGALPIWVDADGTRVAQVVGNLLTNAAKFAQPATGVQVAVAREPGGSAEVRVRDQGVGIEPAFLSRLFEPFMQADATLHRTRGGLGLGLSLVKGLVELHGGTVSARSDGPGQGAEFTVRIPLAPEAPALDRAPPRQPADTSPRRRVLVVEDNADAAETLCEMLDVWGHEVALARDGRAGLGLARSFRPDLILCDIGLPELDGYEVARAIRADPALAGTFLVALTGYASPEDQRKAADAGFHRHLAKPVPIDVIEEVLATAPR